MNDKTRIVSTSIDENSSEIIYHFERDDVNDSYKIDGNNPEIVALLEAFRQECIRINVRTKPKYKRDHDRSVPGCETMLRKTGCKTWSELLGRVGLDAPGARIPHQPLRVTYTIHALDDE